MLESVLHGLAVVFGSYLEAELWRVDGELAYRGYQFLEKKTGMPLVDLAEGSRKSRVTFRDLQSQPRRLLNSPMWSGLCNDGRPYAPFTFQKEMLVPWRTLTGRQHLYLDHPGYIQFGEHVPTYKPKPLPGKSLTVI